MDDLVAHPAAQEPETAAFERAEERADDAPAGPPGGPDRPVRPDPAQRASRADHADRAGHADRSPARRSRLTRRRRILLGIGVAAALLSLGGLIGAGFVKSPAQLAADTAPPAQTVTTAEVVNQDLTASVAMRGTIYPATQYDVSATGTGTGALYISKLNVANGATIGNGELLGEIDGQPLFVLTGAVPAWRDLAPGESGPDVAELQKALASLGYSDYGDTSGFYGGGTEDAVSAFYKHLGYTAPTSSPASAASSGGSADAGTGPEVPQADVVFLPSLPSTVIQVNGALGEQVGSPFLELTAGGDLALTGELPPSYASQIKVGLPVKIYDEATGISATGTVSAIGAPTQTEPSGTTVDIGGSTASGSSGSGSNGSSNSSSSSGGNNGNSSANLFVPVTVTPDSPLPAQLNGENVLVTVETGQTEGAVLTVPVAAIVTTASGESSVTVVGAGGKQTKVPVTPGMSENGFVQVTPVTPGALAAGGKVVVSG